MVRVRLGQHVHLPRVRTVLVTRGRVVGTCTAVRCARMTRGRVVGTCTVSGQARGDIGSSALSDISRPSAEPDADDDVTDGAADGGADAPSSLMRSAVSLSSFRVGRMISAARRKYSCCVRRCGMYGSPLRTRIWS